MKKFEFTTLSSKMVHLVGISLVSTHTPNHTVHFCKAVSVCTAISRHSNYIHSHQEYQAQQHYKNAQRSLIYNNTQRDTGQIHHFTGHLTIWKTTVHFYNAISLVLPL
jgi:hypothetical protein